MATEIIMPRQGQTVEACTVVKWLKRPGESVLVGEVLCEIETDKAAFEVESTAAGTLLSHLVVEGEEAQVLSPIAVVGEPGEDVQAPVTSGDVESNLSVKYIDNKKLTPSSAESTAESTVGSYGLMNLPEVQHQQKNKLSISPRARRRAIELGVSFADLVGSGPNERIIEKDILLAAGARPDLTAAAKALVTAGALAPNVGTGIGGRVRLADIQRSTASELDSAEKVKTIPLTGIRELISERMHQSLQDSAQLTMHATANAEGLLKYRARLKTSAPHLGLRAVTINDLVLYAVAGTLGHFPQLNSIVRKEASGEQIHQYHDVNLAFAVNTERGLMVPVISMANQLSLAGLADQAHQLAAGAQSGSISPDLLKGGTFTVTNLGSVGIENFTPILNPPQVAILGVGALVLKPVVADIMHVDIIDHVSFCRHISLSLTIDHRVVDGVPAAHFLQALTETIADVDLLSALR